MCKESLKMKWAYETMTCGVVEGLRMPGVEYAFEEGQSCLEKYKEMRDVYDRLCDRLGVTDEDEDVEKIIQSLMDIQEELCCRMYRYGAEFGI